MQADCDHTAAVACGHLDKTCIPQRSKSADRHARMKRHHLAAVAAVGMFLCNITAVVAESKAELCLTGNCTFSPFHICSFVPKESWLYTYINTPVKVCRCENTTMAGPRCNIPCPGGHQRPCSGHGECLYPSATCNCDFGWKGLDCSTKCPTTFGAVCAGKGECVAVGDYGAACECFPGFRGGNCTVECVGGAARPCSKRGLCEEDGSCTCLGGWRGVDCSIECPGSNIFPCNMHGKCTREANCECDPLFRGEACDKRCPDVLGIPCGGRGICNEEGICKCNHGYRGADCMLECPGGASSPCSGHGRCTNSSTCECSPSWAGQTCSDVCPGGLNNPCSGHGKCVTNAINKSTATCVCEWGNGTTSTLRWDGFDCSRKLFNIAKSKNNDSFTNMTSKIFSEPEIWTAIIPPITVLLAIMAVIVSRLYTAHLNAAESNIVSLNKQIAHASGLEPIRE